ncbi:MAG: hypothetical protein MIO92_09565 [Methanosarcinaceae archaeon]|nr:hypothetical protein [Methanosarcinaceae archaeon]
MTDFAYTTRATRDIEVMYYTDLWGVYSFDFSNALPIGDTISAVTVEAYVGNVTHKSNLSEFTDISILLIDPAYAPQIVDSTKVYVKFQYPGSDYANQKASLIFEITTDSGAKHPFYFKYVKIRGQET